MAIVVHDPITLVRTMRRELDRLSARLESVEAALRELRASLGVTETDDTKKRPAA